jgi:hypothetical protein
MVDEPDAAGLIDQALDVIALGYPYDGSPKEKAEWMVWLQNAMEKREGRVLAMIRKGLSEQ